MRTISLIASAATLALLAASPALAGHTHVVVGPATNGSVATTSCDPAAGRVDGTGTVRFNAACFRADVGEAAGSAVASAGHLGASANAASHNGDSLFAGIESEAGFVDNFLIFTSSDPLATTASVSANLILDGTLWATGNVASAGIRGGIELGRGGGGFTYVVIQDGSLDTARNDFIIDSGSVGPTTNLHMHTAFIVVPLNSPVSFNMFLLAGAGASGPATFAVSDFSANSFKFAPTAFALPDGVTVNGGDYLVNNHFVDPLAPVGGVPEPAAWALMILGFGAAGAMIRRRRTVLA
jgi:hypothetical protein